MRCPHCGEKIHEPGSDRFCPLCGKELPHQSSDERATLRDRNVSIALLTISLILIMLGGSFILPDVIIHTIDPEMQPMYWPYSFVILVIGVILLIIRHPFAKRSRMYAAIILEHAQTKWTCTYCGAENTPGSKKCESCGAPIKQ